MSNDKKNANNSLEILPTIDEELPKSNQLKREIHPNLPDIKRGALMIIVATVRSGKTTTLTNMFLNPNFYTDCFDTSFFISPTIMNDKTMAHIRKKYPSTCHPEYSDDLIYKICAYQERMPYEERGSYSVVADDCIDLKRNCALTYLASRFRHYSPKASLIIFSTQKFRSLGNTIRTNATDALIGGTIKNKKEREAIIEEYGDSFGGSQSFEDLWDQCNEPYCFLYLKLDRTPCEAYKNFNEKIYPRDGGTGTQDEVVEYESDSE